MKPNDKAYEAARAAILKMISYQNSLIDGRVDNESNTNEIDRSDAIKYARVALDAAYAAQFPTSEDYRILVNSLRDSETRYLAGVPAADALEAVLAERDALKAELAAANKRAANRLALEAERDALKADLASARDTTWFWEIVDAAGLNNVASCEKDALRELVKYAAERDALLARLSPVDDEALVEIAANAISKFFNEMPNTLRGGQARTTIAAIRPHIEAAEREKCAKAGKAALLKSNYGELHADANYADELGEEIAKAIRRGK